MITWRGDGRGGTLWHDLEADRPWLDPAAEADRRQDEIAADAVAALTARRPPWELVDLERFGPLEVLEVEAYGRPNPRPRTHERYAPGRLHLPADDDLIRARRRRVLNEALDGNTSVPYRRGSEKHAGPRQDRDLAG